jgi:hypothetical protein
MKNSPMSPLSKGLLESARLDRPSEAQRSRIWEQVALAPHLSVVAPLAAETAKSTSIAPAKGVLVGGFSASKLLVAGALAGSVLTAGVGMLLFRAPATGRASTSRVEARSVARPTAQAVVTGVPRPAPVVPASETTELDEPISPAAAVAAPPHDTVASRAELHARKSAPAPEVSEDVLMHEAALVSQARTAIVQGRGTAALDVLDLAARDSSHTLEPEELALRVRALRLLGRESEAVVVEEALRSRYPGNFPSH